jgi:putative intracellular protease/amidase
MKTVAVLLFPDFETLDVYGPVEIFGRLTDTYSVRFYSLSGGIVSNKHGIATLTEKLDKVDAHPEICLIPGGWGTRTEISNTPFIEKMRIIADKSRFVLTICTGSALLARTGLLDGKEATTNKRAFDWVASLNEKVKWNKNARWVVDGRFYTSSGVSAGMDMALGFLSGQHGIEFARKVAWEIEYNWIEDKNDDTFSAGSEFVTKYL